MPGRGRASGSGIDLLAGPDPGFERPPERLVSACRDDVEDAPEFDGDELKGVTVRPPVAPEPFNGNVDVGGTTSRGA